MVNCAGFIYKKNGLNGVCILINLTIRHMNTKSKSVILKQNIKKSWKMDGFQWTKKKVVHNKYTQLTWIKIFGFWTCQNMLTFHNNIHIHIF